MKLTGLTPILNVSDVAASLAWFERLGWRRGFTYNDGGLIAASADSNAHGPANFASVCAGECEIFLCRDGQGSRAGLAAADGNAAAAQHSDGECAGAWMSWWLASPAEVDAAYAAAQASGARTLRAPVDEPWGVREFHLRHPDGHVFRVGASNCH